MDWFRVYHGMPEDPKLRLVADLAGVKMGHVVAVWTVLLDQASRARPRGDVASADHEVIAASLGWTVEQVTAIIEALERRRHIVDGQLRAWPGRNPERFDATAKERKQRSRAKQKQTSEPSASHDQSRRDMRDSHASRNVTPTEEKEQSNCSFSDSSKQDCNSSLKLATPRTVRGQAGAFINPGDFWAWINAEGIAAHIGIRTMNRSKLAEWIEQGLTEQTLSEAMRRARAKREREKSIHPVNLGFLACFVDEVLSGAQPTTTTGGGYERGDELSREFANAG